MAQVQLDIVDMGGDNVLNDLVSPETTLLDLKGRLGLAIPSISFADLDQNPVNLDNTDHMTIQEVLDMKADRGVPAANHLNLVSIVDPNYARTFQVFSADGRIDHTLQHTPISLMRVGDLKNLVVKRAASRQGIVVPVNAEWTSNVGPLTDDAALLNTLHTDTEDAIVPIVIMNPHVDRELPPGGNAAALRRRSHARSRNKLKSKRTRRTRSQKKKKRRRRGRKTRARRSKRQR